MGGQKEGQNSADLAALQKELASVGAKLEQLKPTSRTPFEAAFIDGMRKHMGHQWLACLSPSNPQLTAADAKIFVDMFVAAYDRGTRAAAALKLYNDMRAVLGVMLDKLPEIPDPRFVEGLDSDLPKELKTTR